jgi:hypothetical protein
MCAFMQSLTVTAAATICTETSMASGIIIADFLRRDLITTSPQLIAYTPAESSSEIPSVPNHGSFVENVPV